MRRYRVWEANRKVFLYPENWLEPELRDGKSPFFRELESELLKADITDELAEDAYLHYLQEARRRRPAGDRRRASCEERTAGNARRRHPARHRPHHRHDRASTGTAATSTATGRRGRRSGSTSRATSCCPSMWKQPAVRVLGDVRREAEGREPGHSRPTGIADEAWAARRPGGRRADAATGASSTAASGRRRSRPRCSRRSAHGTRRATTRRARHLCPHRARRNPDGSAARSIVSVVYCYGDDVTTVLRVTFTSEEQPRRSSIEDPRRVTLGLHEPSTLQLGLFWARQTSAARLQQPDVPRADASRCGVAAARRRRRPEGRAGADQDAAPARRVPRAAGAAPGRRTSGRRRSSTPTSTACSTSTGRRAALERRWLVVDELRADLDRVDRRHHDRRPVYEEPVHPRPARPRIGTRGSSRPASIDADPDNTVFASADVDVRAGGVAAATRGPLSEVGDRATSFHDARTTSRSPTRAASTWWSTALAAVRARSTTALRPLPPVHRRADQQLNPDGLPALLDADYPSRPRDAADAGALHAGASTSTGRSRSTRSTSPTTGRTRSTTGSCSSTRRCSIADAPVARTSASRRRSAGSTTSSTRRAATRRSPAPQRFWKFLRFRQETTPEFIDGAARRSSPRAGDSELKTPDGEGDPGLARQAVPAARDRARRATSPTSSTW